jgi:hypothetical protein
MRLIEKPTNFETAEVGDVWRAPHLDLDGREAYVVVLPGGRFWYTTQKAGGEFWGVEGDPEHMTVTPSINVAGVWHGWIRNGEFVDAGS